MAAPARVLRGAQWARELAAALTAAPTGPTAAWMERHCELLKRDEYSQVGLLALRGQPCYLKFYLAKSGWRQLGYRLGYGRALHSFDAAGALRRAGLAAPRPLCCTLVADGVLLLTEAIAGAGDLRALWLAPARRDADDLLPAAGATLAALHAAGYAHGDAKWSNLLWEGNRFYFVDLEAVRRCRRRPAGSLHRRQLRDLARFTIDAEELGASSDQFESFLAAYLEGVGCGRQGVIAALRALLPPVRERHRRRYGTEANPLL